MAKKQIESKFLTVSEIAEKANVSRNLVWSYIRKNKIKPIGKEKKKFRFDANVVLKIKEKQNKKRKNIGRERENSVVSDAVLEILHEQLQVKDKQIKDQQATIDFLKNELIQSQLENNKNRKLLEEKQKKEEAVSANDLKPKKERSFWQRLFNI
jgi:predicted site-specific integrase-resolvase